MSRRTASAMVLAGVLSVACGHQSSTQTARQYGAVGTGGRSAGAVKAIVDAAPPVFVSRDREGTRLWRLTQQFYQKRGEEPAWTAAGKPTTAMDELIAILQKVDREGLDPELYGAAALSARRLEAGR